MQQNINYQGISHLLSDHDTTDGPMHLAINVEQRGSSYHAARIPSLSEFHIDNFTPLFIHKPSSDYFADDIIIGAYLSQNTYTLKAYYHNEERKEVSLKNTSALTFSDISDVANFCNIGKIVCFTLKGQLSYLTYKKGSYYVIIGNPPTIDIDYYILRRYKSRVNEVNKYDPSEYEYLNYNQLVLQDNKGLIVYTSDVIANYASELSILTKLKSEEGNKKKEDAILGALNSSRAAFEKEGYLMYPVLVLCAYRLYDGSLIMHTDPILTYPLDARPTLFYRKYSDFDKVLTPDEDKNELISIYVEAYKIFAKLKSEKPNSSWEGIIKSLDFFISAPLYNIETDTLDYTFDRSYYSISANGNAIISLKNRKKKDIIQNVDGFYLIKSIPFEDLDNLKKEDTKVDDGYTISDKQDILPNDLSNYIQNEKFQTSSYDRFNIQASSVQNHNNRLTISNVKRTFDINNFKCFNRVSYLNIRKKPSYADGATTYTYSKQKPSFKDIISKNTLPSFSLETQKISYLKVEDIGLIKFDNPIETNNFFFSFYNTDITAIGILNKDTEASSSRFPLLQNTIVGFSFYLPNIESSKVNETTPIVTEYTKNNFSLVKASEVNNPFVFRDGNSAECGRGEVLTIASNTRAVSQGQFGQYPLFAFCTDGIYAIGIGSDGTLQTCNPYSYDIITSPQSVCNLETSVAYITHNGVHLIGEGTPNTILPLNHETTYNFDNDAQKQFVTHHFPSLPTPLIPPLTYFTQGAHLTYDYPNSRIIVYNPSYPYTYLYSTSEHSWTIVLQSFTHHLNYFTRALLVKNEEIYNYSTTDIEQTVTGLLITRPIKLDSPDVHKAIHTIIQRGNFPPTSISQAVYASNDATHWIPVYSSTTPRIRPLRGTAYKYYRLIIFLKDFQQDYSLTGCTVDFTPRLTNKLR